MYKLIIIYCLIFSTFLNAEELDNISLITPKSYELVSGFAHTFKSKFKVGVGDIIDINVSKIAKEQIEPYRKDLSYYFNKPGEVDSFVDSIIEEGKKNIIGTSLTDAKMIRFYEFMGTKLIGGVFDRVLETEGVKDPNRRNLWVKKLIAPFQACIIKAKNSQYDASHCMDGLTSSVAPSAGVALVYELSKNNLSSSLAREDRTKFLNSQVTLYKDCMNKSSVAAENIKTCALAAMKSGVLKITDIKLSRTITEALGSKQLTTQIKKLVLPHFNYCVKNVDAGKDIDSNLSAKFLECIDNLIESTGMQLVEQKIIANAALVAIFSKEDLIKFSHDKANLFKVCIRDLKKKNIRIDGILETKKCENSVTNLITYEVVVRTLEKLAHDSFTDDNENSLKMSIDSKTLLDKCWNNDQTNVVREACIRSTILKFSQKIATIKLNDAIPNELANKKDLINSNLEILSKCLEEKLPQNITEAENLNSKAAVCTDKITHDLALTVAQETVLKRAKDYNISISVAEELIKNVVNRDFANCISINLTDEKLKKCTGELKQKVIINIATQNLHAKAEGKISEDEINKISSLLVEKNLPECLGPIPNDLLMSFCINKLTMDATKAIVLAIGKKHIKEQLNTDLVPPELDTINKDFVSCMDVKQSQEEITNNLEVCTKKFTLDFAHSLGKLKFKSLMKSILGLDSYNEQKNKVDKILGNYYQCLGGLNSKTMDNGLLEDLDLCIDHLKKDGQIFVSNMIKTWMTTDDKNKSSTAIKDDLANLIPCLAKLLPDAPYDAKLGDLTDSVLKPISQMLAKYIEYSPENAQHSLSEIINKLSTDLKDVATNSDTRKVLLDSLYTNGTLDQFLKAMVRSQVKEAFDKIPETDLPKALRTILLSNANFDKIFASDEGQKLKALVMENILKPALINQAALDSPLLVAGMAAVKDRVIKLLVNSSDFGQLIINSNVQNSINKKSKFAKAYVVVTFGSLDWKKVRVSVKGQIAEKYIKENILFPTIQGVVLTENEKNLRKNEAEKLVKEAMVD